MIGFSDRFFDEEERMGFTIVPMMKKAWAVELDIASQVIDICDRYGLKIYASWGTLLGAVRHKGFIPWDDDMDFDMPRADYMKFIDILENDETDREFVISSLYVPGTHCQPSTTIMNYDMVPIPEDVKKRYYDFPYAAGIDINPMDYVPADEELAESQFLMYGILYDMAQRFEKLMEDGELLKRVDMVEDMCGCKFVRDNTLRQQLWKYSDTIASIATREESPYLTEMGRRVRGQKDYLFPLEWFEETQYMQFEDIKLPVPAGYDGILRLNYGDDYMTPRIGGAAHDYPFYKKQEEYLRSYR